MLFNTPNAQIKTCRIDSFSQVRRLVQWANRTAAPVTVTDAAGSKADGRSLLGLMSLRYTDGPVSITCQDEAFFAALRDEREVPQ